MKTTVLLVMFVLRGTLTFAQSKLTMGPSYIFGLTSIYGSNRSGNMSGMNMGSGRSSSMNYSVIMLTVLTVTTP